MSASLRTKDGSFSTVGAIMAHERAGSEVAPIDMTGALAWAKENRVALGAPAQVLANINLRRAELLLPPFRLVKAKGRAKAATVAPPVAAPTGRPLVAMTEDELLDLVEKHTGTITGLVTPELAGWLLSLNTGNRPLDAANADRFRAILREGLWQNTGEPIIVSREGILNDGQHRLAAVVATGTLVEMDVRFGIPREAFKATGTAKRRTAGNVLSIEGYPNPSMQAAIARLLHHYDAGQMGQYRAQVEAAEIVAIVEREDLVGEVAARMQRLRFGPVRTGPFGFVLVAAARGTPIERVFAFADIAAGGLAPSEDDPARRLNIRIRDMAMKRERICQLDLAILTTRAWNAWLAGRSGVAVRINEGDRTSAGFPRIMGERDPQPAPAT